MATNDQIKAPVKSHAEGDDPQLHAVAIQVTAKAARSGQSRFVQELRGLASDPHEQPVQRSRIVAIIPLPQPKDELGALLNVPYPDARLSDLVLADRLQERPTHVLLERRQRDALARHGLTPVQHLLLTGPPGTGKASTARVIAEELGLPLFSIKLDTVLTKFIDKTAAKLCPVFDALAQTRGVYLFSEVGALGSDRAAQNDVGEIRWVLNSLLQFLEKDTSGNVIIATMDHPSLLDDVLFHRFDTMMGFALPEDTTVKSVIRNRLASFQIYNLSWTCIIPAVRGLSHAEIATAAGDAAKRTILSSRTRVRAGGVTVALEERPCPHQWTDRID